jgi:hypothetical protein
MVEYCVYWLENGEPMHEVFSNLAAAEMYSCAIRGKENVEWVEFSDKEIKNNRDLFVTAQMELPDIMTELAILRGKSRTKTNPKGWIINALKGKIKDK